ncbi:general substrate transporter [Echria macrotheca]|uniref:General substrate transporter n=1 Tax=Echria macrotheca TaxID=438768 RepID=A0AAJ0BAG1_9PEZI|nr:general substrate transporter [Echria macrotheca]
MAATSAPRPSSSAAELPSPEPDFSGRRDDSLKAHVRLVWMSLLASCALLEYGFDQGIISSFQAMVGFLKVFGYEDPRVPSGWNIAAGPQQMISSFMLLGALFACFITGPLGSVLGRTWCIFTGVLFLVASILTMIFTTSIQVLYFARLIMGIGNGLVMSFTYVYMSEIAPSRWRGLTYGLTSGWITIGTGVGVLITNATANIDSKLCYQIPLFVLCALPVVSLVTLPFMPESPRWLLLKGREEQALKSLEWIRNGAYDRLALQAEFEEMRLNALHDLEGQSPWLVLDLFRAKNLRRTLTSVGVGLINPGTGAMFVLAFGTYFYKVVGVSDPFKWHILTQWVGVLGLFCAYYGLGHLGRRTMLLTGAITCGVSMLFLGVLFSLPAGTATQNAISVGVIFLLSWFHFWFNFGLAPTTYLVANEIPAQNLRAYTAGLSAGAGFVFGWLTTFTTPYYINPAEMNWGGKFGYVWFGTTILVTLFIYYMVPEVQGRSLEEIEEMYDQKLPTRKFATYVSRNVEIARQQAEKDLYGAEKAAVIHREESANEV